MRDYNDVLPSKFGEDEAIGERDITDKVAVKIQTEYVAERKALAEKRWSQIETAANLRVDGLKSEWLSNAKRKLRTVVYDDNFEAKAKSILDEAWSLCLTDFKNL